MKRNSLNELVATANQAPQNVQPAATSTPVVPQPQQPISQPQQPAQNQSANYKQQLLALKQQITAAIDNVLKNIK